MFCPNCGTQNLETASTCTKCGFNLKGAAAPKFKGTMLMNQAPGGAAPPPQAHRGRSGVLGAGAPIRSLSAGPPPLPLPRVTVVGLTVHYKSATVAEFIEHHARDVIPGGLFIRSPSPLPIGTLVKFEIRIQDEQAALAGIGRVIWTRETTEATDGLPAGMGVKFIKIDDRSKGVTQKLVETSGGVSAYEAVNLGEGGGPTSGAPERHGSVRTSVNAETLLQESDAPSRFHSGKTHYVIKVHAGEDTMPSTAERTVMRPAVEKLIQALAEVGASLEPQSAEDLVARYARGERDFRYANLEGAVLVGAGLEQVNLSRANLSGADLSGTNLCGTDISESDLRGANLSNANLSSAKLDGAVLGDAGLVGVRLIDASLIDANLRNADLRNADLIGANLCLATLCDANFTGANLSAADLGGANLSGAYLDHADLSHANLQGVYLMATSFRGSNTDGVKLSNAQLGNTIILDVDLASFCEADPSTKHIGASFVDLKSIIRSIRSPNLKDFLQRTGMPEVFVEQMVSLASSMNSDTLRMLRSTFISYGSPDEAFGRKLYEALHRNGVITFFFAEHGIPGEKLHRTMRQGIAKHDRVILICSRASLNRAPVLFEIEEALTREAKMQGESLLIPISLDRYVFDDWKPKQEDLAEAVRSRVIADFEGADTNDDKFQAGLRKLITALRK